MITYKRTTKELTIPNALGNLQDLKGLQAEIQLLNSTISRLNSNLNAARQTIARQQTKLDSITSKEITENGTYEAEVGYNPVTVNVEADVVDFTVTVPADSTNTFTPEAPHQGFKKVKVIAAPDGRVTDLEDKIEKMAIDYTKVGNTYVTPPLADQYGFMVVIECFEGGKLNINEDGLNPNTAFSSYKVGVDGNVTIKREEHYSYYSYNFVGNFVAGEYYPVWFNTNEGNTLIKYSLFEEGSLKSIVIPSTIQFIGTMAFRDSMLSLITCYATSACMIDDNSFEDVMETGVLRVPQGATGYDNWLAQLGSGWTIEYMD